MLLEIFVKRMNIHVELMNVHMNIHSFLIFFLDFDLLFDEREGESVFVIILTYYVAAVFLGQ